MRFLPSKSAAETALKSDRLSSGEGRPHLELHHQRATRDLGDDVETLCLELRGLLEHVALAVERKQAGQQRRPGDGAAGVARDLGELGEEEASADRRLEHAVARFAEGARQHLDLFVGGGAARDGPACEAHVGGCLRGGEAQGAGGEGVGDDLPHRLDLGGRRVALGGLLAHHVEPQRRVADERADVDGAAPLLQRVEVLGEGLEGPVLAHARLQGRKRHAFDALQGLQDQVALGGAGGGDSEAAVAHHDGRDPVPGRDGEHPVPQDLRVVVGVDVDEARGHRGAVDLQRARGVASHLAQGGDTAVPDAQIAADSRSPAAVDQCSAADQEIEVTHGSLPSV